jgi:hypothetical protein
MTGMTPDPKPVRPPGDVSHLGRLIEQWARRAPEETGTAGRLRRLVGVTVVVRMLDGIQDDAGVHRIGFKGGSALELRFGFRARSSKDLDAAWRGELDQGLQIIRERLETGWNGFTAVVDEPEAVIRAGITPPPLRTKLKLRYKNRPFVTIPFEMAAAEGSSMSEPERLPVAVRLEPVQLEGPETIPFLPIRYQIAQKLHACTEDVGEPPNQRVRDLYDILLIEELAIEAGDYPAIREACVEIFEGRHKHHWPPTITAWPGWDQLWANLADNEGLTMTLQEAVTAVEAFVATVDTASTGSESDSS